MDAHEENFNEFMDDQIDLRELLNVIINRKWVIITVFAIIVSTTIIHVFTADPIYKATVRLAIEKENPNVVSIKEVMNLNASGNDYYQTQYKLIESRNVAGETIKRLDLSNNEEFNPKPKDNFISNLKNSINEAAASVGSLMKKNSSDIQIHSIVDKDTALIPAVISRITVQPIRNSRLVDISFQSKKPSLAAQVVNTLAEVYMDKNLETKLNANKNAMKWLHLRIEDERKKVEKAEHALLQYKEKNDIITDFVSDVEKITAQKLAQLNMQLVDAESKRVEKETRYKQATALTNTPDMLDSIPIVLNNDLIKHIKSSELNLLKKISELSKKYGQNHPKMVAIESELKTIRKRKTYEVNRVINSLKNEYLVALAKEKSLSQALLKQKKESLDLNKKAVEYNVLRRDTERARQMYELLINRFKETALTGNIKSGNIRIIDRADVPKHPVKPNKKLGVILSIVVSLFIGSLLCFFIEFIDNTIKDPNDIKKYLDIPYLGTIPVIEKQGGKIQNNAGNKNPVTVSIPDSMASEAYRGLRTSILFSSVNSGSQVMLVTSAGPNEGKTTTSINLAITMAQTGNKVVLLDCDLRNPSIHQTLKIKRKNGITNLIIGKINLKDAIVRTKVPNLFAISAGPVSPNPSVILESEKMNELIQGLKKIFQHIIIDTSPISAVADTVVMKKSVDSAIFVVRANDKPRELIKTCLAKMHDVGFQVLGVVLNGADTSRHGSYYYPYTRFYEKEYANNVIEFNKRG